jgi:AmmeMemoRadiSam system protein A
MRTMRPRLRTLLIVSVNLLGLVVLVAGGLALWLFFSPERLSFDYTVIVRDPSSGHIEVDVEVSGLRRPELVLAPLGPPEQMQLADLRATTSGGKLLSTTPGRDWIQVHVGYRRTRIHLSYWVTPGMLARHGHQGILGSDFGLVAGHGLFLVPEQSELAEARVRFQLPADWTASHPWRDRGDGWLDPRYGGGLLRESLRSTSIGLGRFAVDRRSHGGNTLAVALWPGWGDKDRQRLAERAHGIFAEFDRLFHPQLLGPFTAFLVPRAADGHGVIAGYWSSGLGSSTDDDIPSWSLFAHRIAHVLNRDYPHGTHLEPQERWLPTKNPVNWVNEGVAGFLEVAVPVHGNVFRTDARFAEFFDRYARKEGPLMDVPPLAREAEGDADALEYLHYTRAPLVMVALDDLIRRRSHGQKDLLTFLTGFYATHREHRDAAPFFGDLAAYSGVDVGDFFDRFAREGELVLPLWRDLLAKGPEGPREVVALVAGRPVMADEGFRHARSKDRERARLVDEALTALELERLKASELPSELQALLPSLPEAWKAIVARHERLALVHALFKARGEAGERRLDAHLAQLWRSTGITDGLGSALAPVAELRWNDTPAPSRTGELSDEGGTCLARLARTAIASYLVSRRELDPSFMAEPPCPFPTGGWPPGATFVTLRREGQQRGCIGNVKATRALYRDVVENADRAAAHDPRVAPMTLDELDETEIEVSVLGRLHPISAPGAIRLGTDGILLERDGHAAVYLPSVPDEFGWSLEQTLGHLAEKAGLATEAWHGARLQTFETRVFRDKPRDQR